MVINHSQYHLQTNNRQYYYYYNNNNNNNNNNHNDNHNVYYEIYLSLAIDRRRVVDSPTIEATVAVVVYSLPS